MRYKPRSLISSLLFSAVVVSILFGAYRIFYISIQPASLTKHEKNTINEMLVQEQMFNEMAASDSGFLLVQGHRAAGVIEDKKWELGYLPNDLQQVLVARFPNISSPKILRRNSDGYLFWLQFEDWMADDDVVISCGRIRLSDKSQDDFNRRLRIRKNEDRWLIEEFISITSY